MIQFQLFIKAEKLPKPKTWMRISRKKWGAPNAFAVVSDVSDIGSVLGIKRHRLKSTEVVPCTSSPEWVTSTIVFHSPGKEHRLALDVFHANQIDKPQTEELGMHHSRHQPAVHRGMPMPSDSQSEQLCGVMVNVEHLLRQPFNMLKVEIPGTTNGKITVKMEHVRAGGDAAFQFQLRGCSFMSTRLNPLDRPDFFFEIHRRLAQQQQPENDADTWALVYRSPSACERTLTPLWPIDTISLSDLCNHDLSRDLCVRIYDMDGGAKRIFLGAFETSVHGLMGAVSLGGNCDTTRAYSVRREGTDRRYGQMVIVDAQITTPGHVVDAVVAEPVPADEISLPSPRGTVFKKYMEYRPLELCLAIDFTDRNGDYRSPRSPHYRRDDMLNDYEWLIGVVGETVRDYSGSQEYPVWGFGGRYGSTQYPIFQCGKNAKAKGVSGMLDAYQTTFQTGIILGTERKLDDVIRAAAHFATKQEAMANRDSRPSYTMLVVLMVGDDSDIMLAKDKIVASNEAPISIVFLRIPVRNSGWQAPFDPLKLEVYLGNKRCRNFCSCIDMKAILADRDANTLSEKLVQVLKDQLPDYFQSNTSHVPILS